MALAKSYKKNIQSKFLPKRKLPLNNLISSFQLAKSIKKQFFLPSLSKIFVVTFKQSHLYFFQAQKMRWSFRAVPSRRLYTKLFNSTACRNMLDTGMKRTVCWNLDRKTLILWSVTEPLILRVGIFPSQSSKARYQWRIRFVFLGLSN